MDARARALAVGHDYAAEISTARKKLVEARDALLPLGAIVDTSPIDPLVEWLSILIGENPSPAPTDGRGRRKDSVADWLFRLLVCKLMSAESAFGIRFTLSNVDNKPGGSLTKAVELLRPHVTCIPNVLTYHMLETHRSSHMDVQLSVTALEMLKRLFPPPVIFVRH